MIEMLNEYVSRSSRIRHTKHIERELVPEVYAKSYKENLWHKLNEELLTHSKKLLTLMNLETSNTARKILRSK